MPPTLLYTNYHVLSARLSFRDFSTVFFAYWYTTNVIFVANFFLFRVALARPPRLVCIFAIVLGVASGAIPTDRARHGAAVAECVLRLPRGGESHQRARQVQDVHG